MTQQSGLVLERAVVDYDVEAITYTRRDAICDDPSLRLFSGSAVVVHPNGAKVPVAGIDLWLARDISEAAIEDAVAVEAVRRIIVAE